MEISVVIDLAVAEEDIGVEGTCHDIRLCRWDGFAVIEESKS